MRKFQTVITAIRWASGYASGPVGVITKEDGKLVIHGALGKGWWNVEWLR